MTSAEQSLWAAVLFQAITDAVYGVCGRGTRENKVGAIEAARRYITVPNCDFDIVCSNAGVDPDAVRDRVTAKIEAAPTAAELVDRNGKPNQRRMQSTLTHKGATQSLSAWSHRTGIPTATLHSRIKLNWPAERILTTPYTPRTFKRAG